MFDSEKAIHLCSHDKIYVLPNYWRKPMDVWRNMSKKDLSQFQWKSAHAPKKELPKDFL